ncbi:YrvL family regulatory protein [Sporosarcina sp. FSL K6-6792]|uniref:YrvL family regulatory protein n=1 Tax=Sporosarcina sp. FSL K6-6792 TaxID=2921559 RepID=UPI0030FA943A
MGRHVNKVKTIVICGLIVAFILLGIVLFEFVLLKLLGLQYDSFGALVIFFLIYLFLEVPLSLIADNIPRALKTVGVIESSKGWLSFILDIGLAFILIATIDHFMETIMISWQGALLFALISGIISRKLKENDSEPPMIDSKEIEELHSKLEDLE